MRELKFNIKAEIPLVTLLNFTAQIFAVLALCFALAIRLHNYLHPLPLWIDETFTGAIAGQKDWRDFIFLARADAPPSFLYYCLMHLWQMPFGLSDGSLRTPSLICSVAAPLIIIFSKMPDLPRTEKLSWAALLALWIPGIGFAQDARVYAMLLLFATIQTLTFYRLLQAPTFHRTVVWVLTADLTMFGNYDAAYLALAQGMIFMVMHRRVAFSYWPAIFLALPVIAELAWKWPMLSKFERVGTAWYPILHFSDFLGLFFYPLTGLGGAGIVVWIFLFPVLCMAVIAGRLLIKNAPEPSQALILKLVAVASLMGAVAMITVGFLRPTFTWRYMPPFEPGIILGVVLVARAAARDAKEIAYSCLIVIGVCSYLIWSTLGGEYWDSASTPLNIEQASNYLMNKGMKDVVFTWDSPTPRVMPAQLVKAVGGFFFSRAGLPVNVIPFETLPNENVNIAIVAAAKTSNAAIIWLYDTTIKTTAAKAYAPDISDVDPQYKCINFGKGFIGSVGCSLDSGIAR